MYSDMHAFTSKITEINVFYFQAATENSRKVEMAISFCEMVNCGVTGLGVMSWEVPVATVRHGNFDTLQKIMKTVCW